MNESGEVIAKQTERTVASFKKSSHALNLLAKLDKPNLLGDTSVAAAVFIAKLQIGKFDLAQATAKSQGLELDNAQRRILRAELTDLSVADIYKRARQNRDYSMSR